MRRRIDAPSRIPSSRLPQRQRKASLEAHGRGRSQREGWRSQTLFLPDRQFAFSSTAKEEGKRTILPASFSALQLLLLLSFIIGSEKLGEEVTLRPRNAVVSRRRRRADCADGKGFRDGFACVRRTSAIKTLDLAFLPLKNRLHLSDIPTGSALDKRNSSSETHPVHVSTSVEVVQRIEDECELGEVGRGEVGVLRMRWGGVVKWWRGGNGRRTERKGRKERKKGTRRRNKVSTPFGASMGKLMTLNSP
jgi:hypothetical protein